MKTRPSVPVATDVSWRCRHGANHAPTSVDGYSSKVGRMSRHSRARSHTERGYLLIEALVYIAVVLVLLGVAYAAMYRCVDRSRALQRNADDITTALHAGERWRADIRATTSPPRLLYTNSVQVLRLESAKGPVLYRFATNAVTRRVGGGPWASLLPNVKSSSMSADPREHVTAWRWELELQTRTYGSAKPSRIRPLFTFLAVPETASPK